MELVIKKQFQKYISIGEMFRGKSMTVPNDALTVRQIIEKYVTGQRVPIGSEKFFSDDLPDIRFMEITELQELAEKSSDVINKHNAAGEKKRIEKAQQDAAELEQLRMFKANLEKDGN